MYSPIHTTRYGLVNRISIPGRSTGYFLLQNVHTGAEANSASYPLALGGLSGGGGGKAAEGVQLTSHLQLVQRSKNRGTTPPRHL
jgi:hypothetical protein